MIPTEAETRAEAQKLAREGRAADAISHLAQTVRARPGQVGCWLDLATLLDAQGQRSQALAVVEQALAANPNAHGLEEAKALLLRLSGDRGATEAYLSAVLARDESLAWAHFHLGDLVAGVDPVRGQRHLRRAVELDPANADALFALMQGLEQSTGPDEARNLDEAYELSLRAQILDPLTPARRKLLRDVFLRVCDHEAIARVGSLADIARTNAEAGVAALLSQVAWATSDADKRELLDLHRMWGRGVEARAARMPIQRPPRAGRARVRVGFLSSDLRNHAVGRFATPLFDHVDPERFELFVYSFNPSPPDGLLARIEAKTVAYRNWPGLPGHEAAQRIAADGLDVLVDLGGVTKLNRPDVLAYRPAPVQASWLGYPHSIGLEAIDYFICDRFNRPASDDYLLETPLVLPQTWLCAGDLLPDVPMDETPPSERNGFVTFGTANQPYKYGPDVLAAWARIVAATPGARFAFVRPEAASTVFRRNIEAAFEREGVSADRLLWRPVRSGHLQHVAAIDISLDTFPLTGGTTTIEALWMGSPVVSLAGDRVHERLSHSLLSNVGLAALSTRSVGEYEATAVALAGDLERRRRLRRKLRDAVRNGPLGQREVFARDFYTAVASIVKAD